MIHHEEYKTKDVYVAQVHVTGGVTLEPDLGLGLTGESGSPPCMACVLEPSYLTEARTSITLE